jgi:hypothetical protein
MKLPVAEKSSKIAPTGAPFSKTGASSCVRALSKPELFWPLGLAFERLADAPSCYNQTKLKGSCRGFGVISAACTAGVPPVNDAVIWNRAHCKACEIDGFGRKLRAFSKSETIVDSRYARSWSVAR